MKNLFADIPSHLSEELVETLAGLDSVRIERIVSRGHASPEDFWYDQDLYEFVLVLSGAARLRFEGDDKLMELRPGDHMTISAHCRHRVEWTTSGEPTVWLAVHFPGPRLK